MLVKEAKQIVVSLSKPSKMPCKGYGLPALESCPVGRKLAKLENSTCGDCYACKGQYQFSNVKNAQRARMESISNPLWVDAMVKLIGNDKYFRFHDSGDIFSLDYFKKIIAVAAKLPNCQFWLPTREKGLVSRYMSAGGYIPSNLTIRLSAAMIDKSAPDIGLPTSTVHDSKAPIGHACIAPKQNGECGECRACWDPSIKNVSYAKH